MKIVIPGGTGQVGTLLARAFHRDGHEVVVLSRRAGPPAAVPWRVVPWDGRTAGGWEAELEGADAVINLAGRSVNCRYTAANRKEIVDSRLDSTRVLGEAIVRAARPPRVWLQASTATIYAHRYDAANDEEGLLGGDEPGAPETWNFSIAVATAWEKTALAALAGVPLPATRLVLLRSAIVMTPGAGGPFDLLRRLVRLGLGGRSGDGRQYVSWIHGDDFVRAVSWLIGNGAISGHINLAAPHPLPNGAFMAGLRRAARIPGGFGLPTPGWLLEIAAFFLRTETELILKSRRVVPARLLREGFAFRFPQWGEAARDLCQTEGER
ncbi:hypothetical protein SAMN05444156_0701 [Verrucomicrobium sp. GAS474]|uniref:TIGR01777 family oxidoreductase n=1 Tax=Verrucomicrobium sp. GAS474 TaxID=1882831 RepID=UPI00087A2A91|nr:TIGR01777 family oxidoreductase [Verrucomicrobium sp. GAS474]SDT91517.1 hypothetical protein SAMN05444156_0701 [Verrucomicrobium sp. GAS474]